MRTYWAIFRFYEKFCNVFTLYLDFCNAFISVTEYARPPKLDMTSLFGGSTGPHSPGFLKGQTTFLGFSTPANSNLMLGFHKNNNLWPCLSFFTSNQRSPFQDLTALEKSQRRYFRGASRLRWKAQGYGCIWAYICFNINSANSLQTLRSFIYKIINHPLR